MKTIFLLPAMLLIMMSQPNVQAQIMIGETTIDTTTIVGGLKTPWEIVWGPDQHIWITEREGKISRLNPATGEHKYLLTIPGVHEQSESGLLGMALHPDFPDSSYVYVVYNYYSGGILERLVRYQYNGETLVQPMILLDNIQGAPNHNGSRIVIDGNYKLFLTTGDAQSTSLSQNLSSLSGKILRMNLDGSVPDDNPLSESYIWTWGHRNPQGLVIATDGKIYSSEHGPSSDDELNHIVKGLNYGWPDVHGFCNTSSEIAFCNINAVKEPMYAWSPTLAVAGIAHYANDAIPLWKNNILMANLKASRLESLALSSDGLQITGTSSWFQNWFGRLRDVCVSPDGRVFIAVSNRDGRGSPKAIDDRIIQLKARDQTGIPNSSIVKLMIFPNPAFRYSTISIKSEFTSPGEVIIYDISGNLVHSDVFHGSEYLLNKGLLKAGYYFIRVRKGSNVLDAPLIVI